MYNSQYYTCEQIDQRLLQGYVDDYNIQNGQSLTKEQFMTKLGNIFDKETVIDNTAVNIGYFICDTAAGTAAKAITAAGYALFVGGSLKVKFLNRNTAGSATLNINSQGAKTLYYGGKAVSASNSWDNNEIVEIYYDGTSYYANNVEGNFKDGIFDISSYNLTEGQPTKYTTLVEALGTNGANVPESYRMGGMMVKYVQSSDNKYVQYFLTKNEWSANEADWEKMNLEVEVSQLGKKESDDYYINLAYGAGISDSVNMGTSDRFVMFPIKVKPGDVLEWSASDSGGATMIVSLFYGDNITDYITISSSSFVIDNAHTYKAIRFWRNAASVSVVTYSYKINTLFNVEKEIRENQIQDSLFVNTAVDLEIGELVIVGSAVADPNHLRSDFIPLVRIERLAYHLGGMVGVVNVSFYTAKDFSTQIQSANIMGTAPRGAAQTIGGVLLKSEFPSEAQYVVFCSVRHGPYYTNDGEIHTSTSTYIVQEDLSKLATNILYNREFNQGANIPEWIGVSSSNIDSEGIEISSTGAILNKEYGLAQRTLSVFCTFTNTTLAKITAYATEDTILLIDCANKTFNLNNLESVSIPFFDADHKYNVIIERDYQKMSVSIIDMFTGDVAEHTYVNNGTGGVGQGAEGVAYITGMLHDFPRFDCVSGGSWHISKLQILAKASNYDVMFYGDSITEGETYFPTDKFPKHWIQQIISKSSLKCAASGRGGGQISGVISRIKNELPFVKSKYVVVTIGTNGGNTEENLSQLVEYIISVGSIPILNHIPCNESGTQVSVNALIDLIRVKYGIKGADFDLCTSLAGDGVNVNTDEMWWENYSSTSNIYHHPNVKGSTAMFAQALKDIPEIFG